MLPRNHPDGIQVAFDDHRLVANAGLLLPATLALHLGLPQLVDLGRAPVRANPGDKMMTLVASALAGGDCIDDDALRAGGTARVLGCAVNRKAHVKVFIALILLVYDGTGLELDSERPASDLMVSKEVRSPQSSDSLMQSNPYSANTAAALWKL